MEDWSGTKELYDINLRLNSPLNFQDQNYEINETILSFERAELGQFQEGILRKNATGGYNNNVLINWDTDKEMNFVLSHSILSPRSWMVLSNSKLKKEKTKSISYHETVSVIEKDNYWYCLLKFIPNHVGGQWGLQGNPENEQLPMGRREWLPLKPLPPSKDKFIFCYDGETGKKILNFDIRGNKIIFKAEHNIIVVDYTFDYNDEFLTLNIGDRLLNGFLKLDAKMTMKDYITGEPRTTILEIPKLKLNSNLVVNLGIGQDCATVSDFYFTGYPQEGRLSEQASVCKITFLPTELTGEYV